VGEGWQLFTIRGIPLRIHPSWFLILALFTLGNQGVFAQKFPAAAGDAILWAMASMTSVLVFVSVLLHELGHSLVAMGQGIKVRSITLFLLGGVATVERESSTPFGSLLVAVAGPVVSLLLAAGLFASTHAFTHVSPYLGAMVEYLALLNLYLALFNLLPGLPLDGGLVVKALVWQWTGSHRRGVQVAAGCGRFLSLLAVGFGTILVLRGGGIGGFWLILLGWFGLGAARNQLQVLALQKTLRDLKVREASKRRFRVLEVTSTLRDLSRLRVSEGEGKGDWLLVCDRGRWQGVIDDEPLQALPVQRWDGERIGDHLKPLASLASIREDAPLWQAALQLEEPNVDRLLVLSAAGLPSGTLERSDLSEAVLAKMGLKLPQALVDSARKQGAYPLGLGLGQVARSMVASGETGATGAEDPQGSEGPATR